MPIGEVVSRVTAGGNPVIVVNGNKDLAQEAIDFDKRNVWRVLVGGTKLSRGFTVEGLTISYYRRKTKQGDTLMQMGRWFGFRRGYRDLVRLYIGRAEPDGRRTLDLYTAFEAVVRDEERFRDQLRQYATVINGVPQITPAQIPPLVSQHLPWLKPAARNKMFNAQLVVRRSPGTPVEPTGLPTKGAELEHNYDAALPLMTAANQVASFVVPPTDKTRETQFDAYYGVVDHSTLLNSIGEFCWVTTDYFTPDLAFFKELAGQVDDWVIMMPQLGTRGASRELPGVGPRSLFRRDRSRGPLFQAISDPKHRHAVRRIAGSRDAYGDRVVERLRQGRRGGVLLYPIIERDVDPARADEEIARSNVVIAFTLVAPHDITVSMGQLVQFVARNSAAGNAAIVDVPDD